MEHFKNDCGQLYLIWLVWLNKSCLFIRTTRENKTFLPQLNLFRRTVAKVGEMGKVVNIFFQKKWAHYYVQVKEKVLKQNLKQKLDRFLLLRNVLILLLKGDV